MTPDQGLLELAARIATIEPLQDWTAQLHPKPEKYDRYVAVLTKDQRDTIVSALRALSAECGVKVKALEWIERDFTYPRWCATAVTGHYAIHKTDGGGFQWWSSSMRGTKTECSLDAAKAAAQADFDQRIRSAIVPGVVTDAGERISRLAADLVTSGWMAGDHGIEKAKQDAERKLLEFACDEIKRHMASNPVHPNAAVREALGKPYAWAHPTAVARMTCSTLVMERWRKETGLQPKPLFSDMPQSNDAISAIHDAIVTLDQMCDGSNWPESAQNGDGFRSYTEACEIAATLADELRTILSGLDESSTSSDGKDMPSTRRLDDLGSVQDGRKMSTDGQPRAGLSTASVERQTDLARVTAGETALIAYVKRSALSLLHDGTTGLEGIQTLLARHQSERYDTPLYTRPAADRERIAWVKLSDDTSWIDGRDVVLLARGMEVTARYCPGEWSDDTPISPREYSGAVWSCFDDAFQLEIEECSNDPKEWSHDGATHWRSPYPHEPEVCADCGYDSPCDDNCPNAGLSAGGDHG